jgi:hypothetical protein
MRKKKIEISEELVHFLENGAQVMRLDEQRIQALQAQIGQDVERKIQLLMQTTRIPFDFRSERYDPRSPAKRPAWRSVVLSDNGIKMRLPET